LIHRLISPNPLESWKGIVLVHVAVEDVYLHELNLSHKDAGD
jgi:hypothetical protein